MNQMSWVKVDMHEQNIQYRYPCEQNRGVNVCGGGGLVHPQTYVSVGLHMSAVRLKI